MKLLPFFFMSMSIFSMAFGAAAKNDDEKLEIEVLKKQLAQLTSEVSSLKNEAHKDALAKAAVENVGQAANSQPAAAAGAGANLARATYKYEVTTQQIRDGRIKIMKMINVTSGAWIKKTVTFDTSKQSELNCKSIEHSDGSADDVNHLRTQLYTKELECIQIKVLSLVNGLKASPYSALSMNAGGKDVLMTSYIESILYGSASDSDQ